MIERTLKIHGTRNFGECCRVSLGGRLIADINMTKDILCLDKISQSNLLFYTTEYAHKISHKSYMWHILSIAHFYTSLLAQNILSWMTSVKVFILNLLNGHFQSHIK